MDELTLAGELEQLPAIRAFAREAAETAGLDAKAAYNLQLAVDEIATNIILYGYQGSNLKGDIVLRREITPEILRLILIDTGPEFDPTTKVLDESDLTRPLEERAIGGLGIFLAIQGVDRFEYKRAENMNHNIFEFNRSPAS